MRGKLPRFSAGGASRLSAERVSLAERYTIDADEAEARAASAREQEAREQAAREQAEREQEARDEARAAAELARQLESRTAELEQPPQVEEPPREDEPREVPALPQVAVAEASDESPPAKNLPIYAWFNAQ